MTKQSKSVSKVSASRDGHEFHEAWVARKCLGLLFPKDDFVGIAIEGFGDGDQNEVDAEANEIADAVLYFGSAPTLSSAHLVVIVQVKYSKASEFTPLRAADAKKTVEKFAAAYRACKRKHGVAIARSKLRFELVTNRPVLPELVQAVQGLAVGKELLGVAEEQAAQIKSSCNLTGKDLSAFADQLSFTGLTGDLTENKHRLAISIADWSPPRDPMAKMRLHAVRQLARDKAGLTYQGRNLIRRTDVLTALELQDDSDLLPCPDSFPDVGEIVKREQLANTLAQVAILQRPLLVHADGGVGKTVFMNSIAAGLSSSHEVVLFDCFGMGQYRAPGDARHLPQRGLLHIANDLACRGLCDPLLPTSTSSDDIIRAFRSRLSQAIETVRRANSSKLVVLLLDAIDNAGEQARDRGEDSFPKLLIESLNHGERIEGVRVIVSSRSHRRNIAVGSVQCDELALNTFTPAESEAYLCRRLADPNEIALQVAYSRSRGNARILEHLVSEGQEMLLPSELLKVIELDDLLQRRIDTALSEARQRGYREEEIETFLAALATLPPPVPVADLALANKIDEGAIKSFAADLAPLLEQTKHGLMFRDEPTETLIRRTYSANRVLLRKLADNLNAVQTNSVYAAATLPDLLQRLDDGEWLVKLALDERFPESISSAVGRQTIRKARLRAAIVHATKSSSFDRLVPLLTEMSTLAAGERRGTEYLLEYPGLTFASRDAASLRRMFEARTNWPGTRHSRLAITHALNGEIADAFLHIKKLVEWRDHYFEQDDEYRRERGGVDALDMAAIPFTLLAKGDVSAAQGTFNRWKDWFAYKVAVKTFSLTHIGGVEREVLLKFTEASSTGLLVAAIQYVESNEALQRSLLDRLAQACAARPKEFAASDEGYSSRVPRIVYGFLRAAMVAARHGMESQAKSILSAVPLRVPSMHSFLADYASEEVALFLAQKVVGAVIFRTTLHERDILPNDLLHLVSEINLGLGGLEFSRSLRDELEKHHARLVEQGKNYQYDAKTSAERFIGTRLMTWFDVAQAFALTLGGQPERKCPSSDSLLDLWQLLRSKPDYSTGGTEGQHHYDGVCQRLLTLAFSANASMSADEAKKYAKALEVEPSRTPNMLEVVAIFGARPAHHALAGALAVKVKALIEFEDDVDSRGEQLAALALAIAPASIDEAVTYFKHGLDQMDAIGSGDYQFTGELMQFARELKGDPLSESDSHTFSNICELNLGEAHKFHWAQYGAAMANISGMKGLAKLTRWEDRDKISLDYTLLPYLYALVEADKLDPALALTLLRLSNPAELWVCGTGALARMLQGRSEPNQGTWAKTLVDQYLRNNPGFLSTDALQALLELSEECLEPGSFERAYLKAIAAKSETTRSAFYELKNWREPSLTVQPRDWEQEKEAARERARQLANESAPTSEFDVTDGLRALDRSLSGVRLELDFLAALRSRVLFKEWPFYLKMIASLEALDLNCKLKELDACKVAWVGSSQAVVNALRDCAPLIIRSSGFEFIEFGTLSTSQLKSLSELSGVDRQTLILVLVQEFAHPATSVPAAVWLSVANEFNRLAQPGVGQKSIERLLNSGPAKLADNATDGAWQAGIYPADEPVNVTSGIIWFALGSPTASRRWMAAHSLRTAVSLGRHDVLDQVVAKFDWNHAGAFQARELPFYYLHARLWLLIALARIAQEYPKAVAKHSAMLERVSFSTIDRHVLFKHFASSALIACISSGHIASDKTLSMALKSINVSPHPEVSSDKYEHGFSYDSRPENLPPPPHEVNLDYDFEKEEVARLTNLFGRGRWETHDAIGAWVHGHDPNVTRMFDKGGRSSHLQGRHNGRGEQHGYGEHLCWHALHAVAGNFLAQYPVVRHPYDDYNRWDDWFKRRVLSHPKGLWLADGTDRRPANTLANARDPGGMGGGVTSTPENLLSMLGVNNSIGEFLTVSASWRSMDAVDVRVMSALAPSSSSAELATTLAAEAPSQVYLPHLRAGDEGDPCMKQDRDPLQPWIVINEREALLDVTDVLGAADATSRPRLASSVNEFGQLVSGDPFNRSWCNSQGQAVVRAQAWSSMKEDGERIRESGESLECKASFIRDYLSAKGCHLLLLMKLQRYEASWRDTPAKFWYTTAVVRVTESLSFDFYPGRANELQESRY